MITLTINSATLTSKEAGAAAAMLLALHPDCLADAIGTLDPDQLRLPLVHHQGAADVIVPDAAAAFASAPAPEQTAAEAFAAPGAQPPEAGAPFAPPTPAASPPSAPTPPAPAPASSATAPAAAPAPGVTAAPVTAPAASELDSEGLPWDNRIHATGSDGKGVMTAKGVWRAKRGANQLTVHKIKDELRAALAAPAAGTAAPAPAPAETPAERTVREAVEQGLVAAPLAPAVATPAPPAASAPVAATAAPPPPIAASAPAVSTPSPAPAAADDATPPATLFAAAMRKVTKAQLDGHITVPETDAILTHLGLTQMRDLLARPDLIPVFDVSVDNHVARYVTQ
jgi:hypothetical protein